MTDEFYEPMFRVYRGYDRKLAEVQLDDGTWCDAEIHIWSRNARGAWTAHVQWTHGPGRGNHIDKFAGERVRPAADEGHWTP